MTGRHLTTITPDELRLLNAGMNAFDVNEVAGQALYLRVRDGSREWIVDSALGQAVIEVGDDECEEYEGQLAVSERVRRFADIFDDSTIALALADDETLVVTSGSASAAIDLVPQHRAGPVPGRLVRSAHAVVSAREFLFLLWSARCLPSGVTEHGYPMPPMWMQFGDGWLGLHVDWTDFLPSRATYRLNTVWQTGNVTAAIPHRTIENFLSLAPLLDDEGDDVDLSISIGTATIGAVEREAIELSSCQWRLTLWLPDPLGGRWADQVTEQLESAGLPILDADRAEWLVKSKGVEVRVKLHTGAPDVVRVSAVLLTHVEESLELLRELSQLNAAANGVRYWFEDGVVRVAADVRCTVLTTLPGVVGDVADAASTYAPMLAAFAAS